MRCPWRRGFSCGCLCGRLLLWVGLRGCQSCWDSLCERYFTCWAEARLKIARMTLTIKLDGNWSSFQLANSAPPLSVTGHAIAPSARMARTRAQSDVFCEHIPWRVLFVVFFLIVSLRTAFVSEDDGLAGLWHVTLLGCAVTRMVQVWHNTRRPLSKLRRTQPREK